MTDDTATATATATADPVVVSAMRLTSGELRIALVAATGTFSVKDVHVVADTKLPPVELPEGRWVKAFIDKGGVIGVDDTPVPAVPGFVIPALPAAATPAAGTTSGDDIIDALSPAQAAKADVRDLLRLKGVPDVAMVKSKLRRIAGANGTTADALVAAAKSGG